MIKYDDVRHCRMDTTPPKLRIARGTTRADGKMFYCYNAKLPTGEYWVTPERYEKLLQWREDNKDRIRAATSRYKKSIHGRAAIQVRLRDPDRRARRREYTKSESQQTYARDYMRRRYSEDPLFRMVRDLRSSVSGALRSKTDAVSSLGASILGCSPKEYAAHIEALFEPGMTWDNRAAWHIDHVIPIASAKTAAETLSLFHYTNTRPLWRRANQQSLPPLLEALSE